MSKSTEEKVYPIVEADYNLLEEIGQGVSGYVFRALCIPLKEYVAIKQIDLEKCNSSLDNIYREAKTMCLINHPNVVRAHCSFVVGRQLWVVMPYLGGGSCFHIMKATSPKGFEEPVIATILRETLKALEYLHRQGHIHRDVKAGNILIDDVGNVKLGDFGVTACVFETGDRQKRTTFTGTPCWMAPEVMEQRDGYDFKADIWSFGITALELAHGHAPFSPMKVLLRTLHPVPLSPNQSDRKFSKAFREMISVCLVKDPSKRPSAEKLLKHVFFKGAKSSAYLHATILHKLPPLWDRVANVKREDEARLAQKKMPYGEKEELSHTGYKIAVSKWVDVDDLKGEAASLPDEPAEKDEKGGSETASRVASPHPSEEGHKKAETMAKEVESPKLMNGGKVKGRFNVYTDDKDVDASNWNESPEHKDAGGSGERKEEEGEALHVHIASASENGAANGAAKVPTNGSTKSGELGAANGAVKPPATGCKEYDKKNPLIQKKGRFSVTSADVDLKNLKEGKDAVLQSVKVFGSNNNMDYPDSPGGIRRTASLQPLPAGISTGAVASMLQNIMSNHAATQEGLGQLYGILVGSGTEAQTGSSNSRLSRSVSVNGVVESGFDAIAFDRERQYQHRIAELEAKEKHLTEEIQALKLRNIQVERQLNAHYNREEEERIRREEADA